MHTGLALKAQLHEKMKYKVQKQRVKQACNNFTLQARARQQVCSNA